MHNIYSRNVHTSPYEQAPRPNKLQNKEPIWRVESEFCVRSRCNVCPPAKAEKRVESGRKPCSSMKHPKQVKFWGKIQLPRLGVTL